MPLNFAYTQVSYHPSLWSCVSLFPEFGESPTGKLVGKKGRRGNKARAHQTTPYYDGRRVREERRRRGLGS